MLIKDEVASLLAQMKGTTSLMARLLYGTGMRLMEGLRLRVKDVDFDRHAIGAREAKGNKDRVVMLPPSLVRGTSATGPEKGGDAGGNLRQLSRTPVTQKFGGTRLKA